MGEIGSFWRGLLWMEEEISTWRKKALFGLSIALAGLGLILIVTSLVEVYTYVDVQLAEKLKYVSDACSANETLRDYRPISFSNVRDPARELICGWTAGPTGFRVVVTLLAMVTGAGVLANLLRFKIARVQLALSGAAALTGALCFVAIVVDGNALNTASHHPICTVGHEASDPSISYECHPGKYLAVVALDVLAFLVAAALAAISFLYVHQGHFSIDMQSDGTVDYFGEAEK